MIRMPALPVRKNYYAGPRLANDGRNLKTILPGVLNASVGNIEGAAPDYAENLRSIIRLALPVFGRAARAHLAAREVENTRPLPLLRSFEHSTAAGLLDVITMSSDGQNVEGVLRGGTHLIQVPLLEHDILAHNEPVRGHVFQSGQNPVHMLIGIDEDDDYGELATRFDQMRTLDPLATQKTGHA